MSKFDFDFFVIGAGSGGVRAARMAAGYGARVAIAEERYLGGTCVNVGCVPKKLFVYAADFSRAFRDSAGFGWTPGDARFHWPTLRDNKNREIERLNRLYEKLLVSAGVELFEHRATIKGAHAIEVDGKTFSTRHILIATGGRPWIPDVPGREHALTTNEVFYLETFPERVLIVGGGYISAEFAGIFHGLGSETHVVYRGPLFLRGFDDDLRRHLAAEMARQGIDLRFDEDVAAIEKLDDGSLRVQLRGGQRVEVDAVLYATGRRPNTAGLGLEATAVTLNEGGAIEVDDRFRSAEPSIYAVGDVIDRVPLTPVAIHEAMVVAANLFNGGSVTMDYDNVPSAVFSSPPIATVGLTEEAARERYGDDLAVYATSFKAMKQTLAGGEERTLMKLLVEGKTERVVGCHMVGDEAGEIIQGLAVALKAGATKGDFDATVGIHPTAAEEFVTMRNPR